ncbi:MAG: hypothetical protein WAZ40_03150 [Minisyncoccia bacterium]
MEHIIKQIKKGAKHTRLSLEEKAEMRSALVLHMQVNPVLPGVHSVRFVRSPFSIRNLRNKKGVSILVIGGLLMSGSVSFAAEGAVPGDVLFPIKVHVNEPVLGAVAVTPKARADWQVRLVERRLEEVEKISVMPDVSPEVRQVAEQNLASYTEEVEAKISKFDNDDDGDNALQTASRLSNVYNAHEKILSRMNKSTVATTTLEVQATTTLEVVATSTQSFKKEGMNKTLEKVRGAQNTAEKKRGELKKKYEKGVQKNEGDANVNNATSTKEVNAGATSTLDISTSFKNKSSRKEEFRSQKQGSDALSASVINANKDLPKNSEKRQGEDRSQTQKQNSND